MYNSNNFQCRYRREYNIALTEFGVKWSQWTCAWDRGIG